MFTYESFCRNQNVENVICIGCIYLILCICSLESTETTQNYYEFLMVQFLVLSCCCMPNPSRMTTMQFKCKQMTGLQEKSQCDEAL